MAHCDETSAVGGDAVLGLEELGEFVAGPGAGLEGVCEGAVTSRDLRAETIVGDYDDEIEGGEVGGRGSRGVVLAADHVAAPMED